MSKGLAVALVALAACAQPAERQPAERQPEERPAGKPTAAVRTTLGSQPLGKDRYRVTFVVTPTADADALELRLEVRGGATVVTGPTLLQLGPTRAGERRELVAEVSNQGASHGMVFGHTSITIGGKIRSTSADMVLVLTHDQGGPARPAGPPIRQITLPDGTRVAETRP